MDSYWKLRILPFLEIALPFFRLGFLVCVLACALLATYDFASQIISHDTALLDFTVFWTAVRFEHVYDSVAFTQAQISHLPTHPAPRPFPYPPTALLFLAPLRWFDFDSGAMIWTAAGVIAFLFACRLYGRAGLLVIFAPMVALSVLAGQATLLLGAAMSAGVAIVERRPILAGTLFGLVGAIKPTMAALVPVALIAGGHRRALATSILTGTVVVTVSLLLGPSMWLDWSHSIPGFLNQVMGRGFRVTNMSPGLWFVPVGLLSVMYVFYNSRKPEIRLLALVSGTACCTPYMMGYDMATMAPGGAALMLKRNPLGWLVGCLAFAFVFLRLAPAIAIGAVFLVAFQAKVSGGGFGLALNNARSRFTTPVRSN